MHAPFTAVAVLIIGIALGLGGCATAPTVSLNRPEEHVFLVQANQLWQDSGVKVRTGNIIHCRADGKWSDPNGSYDANGNPEASREHLGVRAPVNALLLKVVPMTNSAYYAGRETNIVTEYSGTLLFRNNVSLTNGMSGTLSVRITVAPDADGDGLSDYDEIQRWQTSPLSRDTDGDGFSDYEEVMDRQARSPDRRPISP